MIADVVMGSCFSLRYKYFNQQDHHHLNGNTFSHYSLTSATSYLDFLYPTFSRETEPDEVHDMGDPGDGDGGGGRRTTLPLIDEWGEIVLNDGPELDLGESEYLHDNVFSESQPEEEGETADLAHHVPRHVREAERRGFHDEDVGRPAFGYEQFDRDDVRIGGGGDGHGGDGAFDEEESGVVAETEPQATVAVPSENIVSRETNTPKGVSALFRIFRFYVQQIGKSRRTDHSITL